MLPTTVPRVVRRQDAELLRRSKWQSLKHLVDYEFCENFPSFRKSGFQHFCKFIKITPYNFPHISYLNLDGSCLIKRCFSTRFQPWQWAMEESLALLQVLRLSKENAFTEFENYMLKEMVEGNLSHYIRKFLRYCRVTERCLDDFEAKRIYSLLTLLLYEVRLKDPQVTTEFFESLFGSEVLRNDFLFESRYDINIMEYHMEQARNISFDMWGLLKENPKFLEFPLCAVTGCLLNGNYLKMDVLLRYGLQRVQTTDVIHFYRSGKQNPLYERYGVIEMMGAFGLPSNLPERTWETYSIHRAFLVIEMIFTLCHIKKGESYGTFRNWTKVCELLWRAIPDSYLSLEEIRRVLQSLSQSERTDSIDGVCDYYAEVLPGIFEMTTRPRCLQHLCRCVIRRCLKKNYFLPWGLDNLPLPTRMIEFLRLQS